MTHAIFWITVKINDACTYLDYGPFWWRLETSYLIWFKYVPNWVWGPENKYLLVVFWSHGSWSIIRKFSLHRCFYFCWINYCFQYSHTQVVCNWLLQPCVNKQPFTHHCNWLNKLNFWYNLTNEILINNS